LQTPSSPRFRLLYRPRLMQRGRMRSPRPASRRTAYVPRRRRGRSLRVRRRAKRGGVSRRITHLRKAHGVFGGESGVSADLGLPKCFLPPLFVKNLGSCECKYIYYMYILSCVLHLLPMDNSSYGKVITYEKVKGLLKVQTWHQGPNCAPPCS